METLNSIWNWELWQKYNNEKNPLTKDSELMKKIEEKIKKVEKNKKRKDKDEETKTI